MTKFWVLSDLHLDVNSKTEFLRPAGVDAVLIAGDTQNDKFLESQGKEIPTFFIAGNHEFYHRSHPGRLDVLDSLDGPVFLENSTTYFRNVRIIGSTLWTDYDLYGEAWRGAAMLIAMNNMNDHRLITWRKKPWARFRPQEASKLHRESKAYIELSLSNPHDGPTIVMTHHAPSIRSINPKYGRDHLNSAYASNLDELILQHQPDLWIHGHVHSSFDYNIGKTRILCNPHGYGHENPDFNPALVLEL